jgi:N-acyl-D-aspartate/D-glutamate deacylase
VLSPGFIDIHTHYDVQVLWDPDLTPSSWHGVTSVVMGNCGFGVAPLRARDGVLLRDMLATVEGMPLETVETIVGREFPTVGDYMQEVQRCRPRLNVGFLVGHSALRFHAMGPDALDRPASPTEIGDMASALRSAMAQGALGLSTSRSPGHLGPPGRPVPSRMAALAELDALAMVLADVDRGVIQVTPGPDLFIQELGSLSARIGRPITWAALLVSMADFGERRTEPGAAKLLLDEAAGFGGEVWPQISCRPVATSFTLLEPYTLRRIPAFRDLLTMDPNVRRASYAAGSAWRESAVQQLAVAWDDRWDRVSVEDAGLPGSSWQGRSVRELAAESHSTPATWMIDFAVQDNLQTRFAVQLFNDDVGQLAHLLTDPRCVLGLSDAGAHADQLCDAVFPTFLLGTWVRERQDLPLETAIWRLSGQPAQVMRIDRRGLIKEGCAADLVAFDPTTVGALPLERVRDLPKGIERLIGRSAGIEDVWVNGVPVRLDGQPTDRPGAGQRLDPVA